MFPNIPVDDWIMSADKQYGSNKTKVMKDSSNELASSGYTGVTC